MSDTRSDDLFYLGQIGLLCVMWAIVEYGLELIIWWELKIEDDLHGRSLTSSMDIEKRARTARDLIRMRSNDPGDSQILEDLWCYVQAMKDRRHLAVHGARITINGRPHAVVSRGKWKYTPIPLARAEMDELIEAVNYTQIVLSNFIAAQKIAEDAPLEPVPDKFPALLQKCHQSRDQTPQARAHPPESSLP